MTSNGTEMFAGLSGYSDTRDLMATRYRRGNGREVFVVALPISLVPSSLPKPDPNQPFEGNRRVNPGHARKFAEYWRENEKWACPPVMLDTPDLLDFEPRYEAGGVAVGILKLPHNSNGVLDILDGQHRILGWCYAIDELREEIKAWRAKLRESTDLQNEIGIEQANERLRALEDTQKRLNSEFVTIELLSGVSGLDHKQAFSDISNNALGITKSKTVEFDSRSVVNRIVQSLALSHPLLEGKVDFDLDRVQGANENLISARNLSDVVRTVMLGIKGRMTTPREKLFSPYESSLYDLSYAFFDALSRGFENLNLVESGELAPADLRKTSLLGSPTVIRCLAGMFHNVCVEVNEHDDRPTLLKGKTQEFIEFLNVIDDHTAAPVLPGNPWMKTGVFPEVGGMAPSSRSQDLSSLTNTLTSWFKGDLEMPF